MLYYIFRFLEQYDIPGAHIWSYVSFRSLLALILSLLISAWFGEYFIKWMKRRNIEETARDASIDPFGVEKKGVPTECEDTELDNASYYGRIFAKSGGVAQGVAHVAQELGVEGVRSIAMNGIDQCRTALTLLRAKKQTANFFEGMACDGGCIGGPLCITHSPRNIVDVDEYGNQAKEKGIGGSVELYKLALRREGGEK